MSIQRIKYGIRLLAQRRSRDLINNERLRVYWHRPRRRNWGDSVTPMLIKLISGREIEYCKPHHPYKLVAMGSIMCGANGSSEIWGTGSIRPGDLGQSPPRQIHAVRGPLTREQFLKRGIPCPAVYGDPALLWPRYFPCTEQKKYDVTIIPHYREWSLPAVETLKRTYKVLDPGTDFLSFPSVIAESRRVLSSSLHGLILADAYGVPNARIRFSDVVVGRHFKYIDHNAAVGKRADFGIEVPRSGQLDVEAVNFQLPTIDPTDELLRSFPLASLIAAGSSSRDQRH